MFDAGVEPRELGQIVEGVVAVVIHEPGECPLDLDDVDQVAVLVEVIALEAQFEHVVMRVQVVLRAPVTADEEVLGDEIAFDGHGVHQSFPPGKKMTCRQLSGPASMRR